MHRLPVEIIQRCRVLREAATPPEALLWQCVRNRALGKKFRRQHPVGGYVLDFYCPEARLAVELDGSGHLEAHQMAHDSQRTAVLEALGIHVLRFWNSDVSNHTEAVLGVIWEALYPETP